jgi:hypothetical protein
MAGTEVDLSAVNGAGNADRGVAHGAELLAFTAAVMGDDDELLARERAALRAVLSPECFVDAAAIVAAFNVVDRIADATGIPLDDVMLAMSGDVPTRLDLGRFASSANTPNAPR